jgi:predicted nucleic acid-binding Zn ribbon protein
MSSCPCSSCKTPGGAAQGPLGDLVKKVIKKIGGRGRLTEEEIAAAWAQAAGKRGAKHTRPVSFRKSTLTVNVDGSGWLYELTTKKRQILKKLGSGLAGKKVKDIRFRIGEIK